MNVSDEMRQRLRDNLDAALVRARADGEADRYLRDLASEHRIAWFGVIPGGERVRRTRHMSGRDWGWDASCSCGWDSRTGGAIQERIREAISDHRWEAAWDAEHAPLA